MTTKVLTPYNKELAQSGALVCWENGDGPLRYVGPATDAAASGCFLWLAGCHRGTYAAYHASELRMAPDAFRSNGWYFVRKKTWGDQYDDWVPAEWRQESKSWYSTKFSGIPDSEVIVGERLEVPVSNA
jgi:hypothetical protein